MKTALGFGPPRLLALDPHTPTVDPAKLSYGSVLCRIALSKQIFFFFFFFNFILDS
jgi:hypothetical protein